MDEDRHNPKLSRISLFVSSPGDVAHERRVARETIARLNAEFADRIVLDAYFWEYERFDFSKSFQEQIPNTATFDVVLCLLWSRLGSRLGPRNGFPTAHRRTRAPSMKSRMLLSARRSVMGCQNCTSGSTRRFHRFSRSRRRSTTKGSLSGALSRDSSSNGQRTVRRLVHGSFTAYHTIADFQDLFEVKLCKIAERRVALSPGTLAPPAKRVWTERSPFRGLEPFDFKHAPIFFGRTAAVSGAIEALRKTQSDKDDPRSFLLVLGASGSGKSSLARAGILPVVTEPGVIEGVGLWRRAVMKPSDAGGDVLVALRTLCFQSPLCRSWRAMELWLNRSPPVWGRFPRRSEAGCEWHPSANKPASGRRSRLSFASAKMKAGPRTRRPCASVCRICILRPRGLFCSSISSKSCLRVEFPRKNGTRFSKC